jgi:nucleoside-diphosphate-sugar epimerase
VLVSSLAAAGPAEPGRRRADDEPPAPVTTYGRSKLEGEQAARESGVPTTVVRPPMVYGPRDVEVLKVFRLAARGLAFVFGDGRQQLCAIHVDDLVRALLAVVASPAARGRTYCACHPELFTSREFVRAVGRAIGRESRPLGLPSGLARTALSVTGAAAALVGRATLLNRDKANEFLAPAWTGDSAPLTRDTGWRAAIDLASGLAATAEWYRERGWIRSG